ncbi:MAG: 2-isopropylmalate synthase [Fibrobacterota bacterium]
MSGRKNKVLIFDTTLRDGEQALMSSLTVNEKIVIAKQLAKMKVDIIEAGFPVSSPGDFESVSTIAKTVKGPIIAGLARAVKKDIDACAKAVKHAKKHRIHTFIGTSTIHMKDKLRKSEDQILEMAVDAVKYARRKAADVEFSCEDTGRTPKDFLYRIVEAVIKAGAGTVNLPDTVGYTTPAEFGSIISGVMNNVPNVDKAVISVHCHNDLGMATANSISAVENGARQVECTVNGIGERAGNASLEEIVMILKTRKERLGADSGLNTKEIANSSRIVSHLCNMPVQANKAVVGSNAFSHSSGIHQDGVIKAKNTYEIMTPESIGLTANKLNLTSRSGRHVIKVRLSELGFSEKDYNLDKFYARFLELADRKGRVYDDDLEALMRLQGSEMEDKYSLKYLNVSSGTGVVPVATVSITDGKKDFTEAATGDGPVDAASKAIDRITGFSLEMHDYKLSAGSGGREALALVDIVAGYEGRKYHGSGTSTDIVEASVLAYINVVNKIELSKKSRPRKKASPKKTRTK